MGPRIDIGCTVESPRRGTNSSKVNLYQVIEAVRQEMRSAEDQLVADVVLYMMDTGRIRLVPDKVNARSSDR